MATTRPKSTAKRGRPRKTDIANVGVLYVRVEQEILDALDKEAAEISKSAHGLTVSRSDAARIVLRKALAGRLGGSS